MEHKHGVYDSDTRFSINPITRQIKNDSNRKIVLIQNDHKSEIFTFECPRTVEGHDMSLCTEVEVHFLNIASDKKKENSGFATLKDFRVDPEDSSKVVCSWEIDINATRLAGSLNFLLFFKCKEDDVITYGWHTAIFEGIFISKGINADESFESDYVDVIERWKAKVTQQITAEIYASFTRWKNDTEADLTTWKQEESDEVHAVMGDYEEYMNRQLATERARIDQIVALPNGSTTGDAELQDIRVAVDGTVHESAGTAVRTQFRNLQDNVESMFSAAQMKLFPLWERGGINGESGNETVAVGRFRTADYISLGVTKMTIKVMTGYMVYYFGYTCTDGVYTLATHGSCDKDKTITLDPKLFYRFVVRSLAEDDYMEDGELVNAEFIFTPDVIYAKDANLKLTNNTIRDIAEHGYMSLQSPWIVGGINGGNGTFNDATNRIRTTEYFKPISNTIHYSMIDGYRMLAFEYTKDAETGEYTFVKSSGYYTGECSFEASVDSYYLFVFRAIEDVEFTGDEYTGILIYSPIALYEPKNVEFTVPGYWKDVLVQKEREIKDIVVEATKADHDVAMFFTSADPHYPGNTCVSTILRKHLSEKCGITLMVCLGDLITDSTVSHDDGLDRIQDAMLYLAKGTDRMIFTQGNHDNNAGIVDGNGQILAERIVYDKEWIHHTSSKLLPLNGLVFDENHKAFYYDDALQKIRFISIDSFEGKTYSITDGVVTSYNLGRPSDRQIEWIRDEALSTVPDGYAVVSFSHLALFTPYVHNGTEYVHLNAGGIGNSTALVKVFRDFMNRGGVYVGHFAGHLHHDFVSTKDGITCVQSLNDGMHWRDANYFGKGFEFVGDAPVKTEGTVTECAFDVVIINKTTRHVDLIRVGAGDNRSFNY